MIVTPWNASQHATYREVFLNFMGFEGTPIPTNFTGPLIPGRISVTVSCDYRTSVLRQLPHL